MLNWAENEVKLACEKEAPNRKDGEWNYGCSCYESALKAYKSLCEDDHSGMSFAVTKNILIKLINNDPLTPIEDTDDIWNECGVDTDGHFKVYQCKRKNSLFKDVYYDGHVEYHDIDQFIFYDINDKHKIGFHNGFMAGICREYRPIIFPYSPSDDTRYRVRVHTSLRYKGTSDDYDTLAILDMNNRSGTDYVPIFRYFTCEGSGTPIKISQPNYEERLHQSYKPNLYTKEEEK